MSVSGHIKAFLQSVALTLIEHITAAGAEDSNSSVDFADDNKQIMKGLIFLPSAHKNVLTPQFHTASQCQV